MRGVCMGKPDTVVVSMGTDKKFVWGWRKLASGAPHKVLLRGDIPTRVFLSEDCVGRICVGQ